MEPNCPHLAPAASLAAVWSWGSIFWPGQGVWAAPWGAAQAPWEGHLDSQFHLFVCDQPHPGAPRYSTVSGCQASWTRRAVSGRRGHDPRGRDKEQENSGRKAVQSGPHTPQRPDASSGVPEHPGPKPGSEPKVYHQGEASSFQIQRPASPQSRLTKDYDRDEEEEEEDADNDRCMLTPCWDCVLNALLSLPS